jgi:hypothetical protein
MTAGDLGFSPCGVKQTGFAEARVLVHRINAARLKSCPDTTEPQRLKPPPCSGTLGTLRLRSGQSLRKSCLSRSSQGRAGISGLGSKRGKEVKVPTLPQKNAGRVGHPFNEVSVVGLCERVGAGLWFPSLRQAQGRPTHMACGHRRTVTTSPSFPISAISAMPMNRPCSTTPGMHRSFSARAGGSGISPKVQSRM